MSDDNITRVKRESVYAEGELSFEQGRYRKENPYSASSPILEQIWWNGWDHARRVKQREGSPRDERK
jgi:hypothetical protein